MDDRTDWDQVSEEVLIVSGDGIIFESPTLDSVRCEVPANDYLVEIAAMSAGTADSV